MDSTGYRNRMEIAWKNVRANRNVRPVDMINGYRMIHPLRSLDYADESFDLMKLVLDLFTRLEVTYQPVSARPTSWPRRGGIARVPHVNPPWVGLFVDAPDHLSGVTLTLGEWASRAQSLGCPLTIHSCGTAPAKSGTISFSPMGTIKMDAYAGLQLHVPRVDDVLRYIDQMEFDVIHVSTPGPMGLLGLLAARHRGLPVCGTYHTDFPRYAGVLSGNPAMEEVGWKFMRWFYGQLDRVAAPTDSIRRELVDHGFDPARLSVVGRGVNTSEFSPAMRSEKWRTAWGQRHSLKLLYVGRISREKNLEVLVHAMKRLRFSRPDICLVVVGEGPYREEMERALASCPAFFTGTLKGRELATAYASADLFVFPSKTDTFGRVVLEAQASGLPVIVSSEGGPKDAMLDQVTGVVIPAIDAENLAGVIDRLTDEPGRHARLRQAARDHAMVNTPEASFESFWQMHRDCLSTRPTTSSKVLQ